MKIDFNVKKIMNTKTINTMTDEEKITICEYVNELLGIDDEFDTARVFELLALYCACVNDINYAYSEDIDKMTYEHAHDMLSIISKSFYQLDGRR